MDSNDVYYVNLSFINNTLIMELSLFLIWEVCESLLDDD